MSKKLYVGGLSYSTSEDSLTSLFTQAGIVDSARIITDRDTGRPKGFGFVEMSTDSEAENAINMFNGMEFEGRNISVNEARPQADRPQRRDGGNYGSRNSYGNNRGGRY